MVTEERVEKASIYQNIGSVLLLVEEERLHSSICQKVGSDFLLQNSKTPLL